MNPFHLFGGESYKLPTIKKPSMQNIEGGIGLFGGMYAGLLLGGAPFAIALAATGAILGGTFGKNRMQYEYEHGRDIHPPSIFNRTWMAGTLVGLCAAAVLVPMFLSSVPIIGTITAISLIAGGSIIGSLSEYLTQREDFKLAKERNRLDLMKEVSQSLDNKAPTKAPTPKPELPEFKNTPNSSQWTHRNPSKAAVKQPDYRTQVQAPSAPSKGGIA